MLDQSKATLAALQREEEAKAIEFLNGLDVNQIRTIWRAVSNPAQDKFANIINRLAMVGLLMMISRTRHAREIN